MSLNIGKAALNNAQIALDLVGKNIAHANDPTYARQRLHISSTHDGNVVQRIEQAVNISLEHDLIREREQLDILSQIETSVNELTDADLSSALDSYYEALEQLSLSPHDVALRRTSLESAQKVVDVFQITASSLSELSRRVDREIGDHADVINNLIHRIGELNVEVARREGGVDDSPAVDIRDRRRELVSELSALMNITTTELSNGSILVQSDGRTLVFQGESRGVYLDRSEGYTRLRYESDNSYVEPSGGTLGGLIEAREEILGTKTAELDALAADFIWSSNKVHNTGRGLEGLTSFTSNTKVSPNFVDLPLDETVVNSISIGNAFKPVNGQVTFQVRNEVSGDTFEATVDVTLLGDDKTSLQDLSDQIDQIEHINSSVDHLGRLSLESENGYTFFVQEDTSNVTAYLGLNDLFSGNDAKSIEINEKVLDDPRLLAAGKSHNPGDNTNLAALLATREESLADGRTFSEHYEDFVSSVASSTGRIQALYDNQERILSDVQQRRDQFSGVNLDEEAASLLRFQQSYQAAAQYISVQNQLIELLFQAV